MLANIAAKVALESLGGSDRSITAPEKFRKYTMPISCRFATVRNASCSPTCLESVFRGISITARIRFARGGVQTSTSASEELRIFADQSELRVHPKGKLDAHVNLKDQAKFWNAGKAFLQIGGGPSLHSEVSTAAAC